MPIVMEIGRKHIALNNSGLVFRAMICAKTEKFTRQHDLFCALQMTHYYYYANKDYYYYY